MTEQTSTWPTQAAPKPPRFVPPLPQGVPIVPGLAKIRKRSRKWIVVMVIIAVVLGIYGVEWVLTWYSNIDGRRIEAIVTPAMFAHAPFGTRLPVTLRDGPRILSIGTSYIEPGVIPQTTCVEVYIYYPNGALDRSESDGPYFDCIPGLAYEIMPPMIPTRSHR
jgi:hypothetical protein